MIVQGFLWWYQSPHASWFDLFLGFICNFRGFIVYSGNFVSSLLYLGSWLASVGSLSTSSFASWYIPLWVASQPSLCSLALSTSLGFTCSSHLSWALSSIPTSAPPTSHLQLQTPTTITHSHNTTPTKGSISAILTPPGFEAKNLSCASMKRRSKGPPDVHEVARRYRQDVDPGAERVRLVRWHRTPWWQWYATSLLGGFTGVGRRWHDAVV